MDELLLTVVPKQSARRVVQVGWREWLQIPVLKIKKIKVKIDTGAKTSALHVDEIKFLTKNNRKMVRFTIHPLQKSSRKTIRVTTELLDHRWVKSSNGAKSLRPVIQIEIQLGNHRWPIEVTLTSRDEMGFRMLLGRSGIPKRFVVNPHKSFIFKKAAKATKPVTTERI